MASSNNHSSTRTNTRSSTVSRILDAAENLFAQHGFAETSLRSITSQAGVNLAAVNYHFGSKKELIQAVFTRFLDPFCQRLSERLDEFESRGKNEQPTLEDMLHLLVDEMTAVPHSTAQLETFMRLLALAYNQTQGHLKKYLELTYRDVFERYMKLLIGAAPTMPAVEIYWRINFILGASLFTMSEAPTLQAIAERDYGIQEPLESVMRRMVPFMAAGMRSGQVQLGQALQQD
ncbi:TetR/AcrR family transcriptional regulator [Endozoicomonadaceae bacterium StTr2]